MKARTSLVEGTNWILLRVRPDCKILPILSFSQHNPVSNKMLVNICKMQSLNLFHVWHSAVKRRSCSLRIISNNLSHQHQYSSNKRWNCNKETAKLQYANNIQIANERLSDSFYMHKCFWLQQTQYPEEYKACLVYSCVHLSCCLSVQISIPIQNQTPWLS